MKIVVGHKTLNLEELYDVSCHPVRPEVVIDNPTHAELGIHVTKEPCADLSSLAGIQEPNIALKIEHERAILLVKLIQLLKLKKGTSKVVAEYIVRLLNADSRQLSGNGKTFFQGFFEACRADNIFLTEKELFIMTSTLHIYQAVFALESYKLTQKLPVFDSTLVLSLETLNVHEDYFSPYALTLGKQSIGINNFKNHVLSLSDKSKMINTQIPNKTLTEKLQLNKVYALHALLHERLLSLNASLSGEINSDYGSLFNEKKYKELMAFAKDQQREQQHILERLVSFLVTPIQQLRDLSSNRASTVQGKDTDTHMVDEETKTTEHSHIDTLFTFLNSEQLFEAYSHELYVTYIKNKNAEAALKAKAEEEKKTAEEGAVEGGKQPKKKKAKEGATTLNFGKGTRQFFEHLLLINEDVFEAFKNKIDVHVNRELEAVFEEILEAKNEERRRPKCAKGTRDMTPLQMAIKERAFNIIKGVFKKHGASEIDTPVFELKETLTGKYGEESKLIYDLDDQGGELLALRYDLTVPFARHLGEKNLSSMKRFHIAKVYRRDNPQMSKGRFREFYQCDFDIAGAYSLMIPDAEVLKVLMEILTQLDIGNFVIKVNHRKFLDAMVDLCGCEKRKFKAICSSVDKLDKEPWSKVREELITTKGLTVEQTDKLEKFVELKGKPKELLQLLKDRAIFAGHKEGEDTIKEMDLLFSYLEAMDGLDNLQFDFSLARGLDYYTGLIYEAILTDTDRVGSIAGGGRYDGLVGMFSRTSIPAVGVSVGIERIFSILEERAKVNTYIRATETQILIAQIGKNLVQERLKICNELWQNGIKAETLYNDNPKPQKQLEYSLESGIPLIMWIGGDEVKEGIVKVKSLSTTEEHVIKREELVERVRELVAANPILIPSEKQELKEEKKEQKEKQEKGKQQKQPAQKQQPKGGKEEIKAE